MCKYEKYKIVSIYFVLAKISGVVGIENSEYHGTMVEPALRSNTALAHLSVAWARLLSKSTDTSCMCFNYLITIEF